MKKYICMALFAASFLAFAQEGDMASRIKSLEESVDQLKRDKAKDEAPELIQNLDWGQGWGWSIASGNNFANSGALAFEAWTQDLGYGIHAGLIGNAFIEHSRPAQDPNTDYTMMLFEGGAKVYWTSPLFFNFSRMFFGIKAYHTLGLGLPFDQNNPSGLQYSGDTMVRMIAGTEFFISPASSVYFEFEPTFLQMGTIYPYFTDSSLKDLFYANAHTFNLKFGIKFY